MDRFEELEPGQDDLPLGPHPLAFVAVLVGVLVLAWVSTSVFLHRVGATSIEAGPRLVQLPEVIGLDQTAALGALETLGFTVFVDEVPNNDVPAGEVITQAPLAGSRVSTERTVTLTVSGGSGFVSVPDMRGSPLDDVELMFFTYGVALGDITEQESDLAAGEVVSQDPPGGKVVAVGTRVDIVVSSGPPLVEIPDVTGMEAEEAARTLTGAGFTVVYKDRYSWRVRRGHAIGTDPEDEAPRGSQLTLEISRGSAPTTTTAPPAPDPAAPSDPPESPSPPPPTTPSRPPGPPDRPGGPGGPGGGPGGGP